MTERARIRRRHPRVALPEAVEGEVGGRDEVLILDLSLGGARLAHTDALRPRASCILRFTLNESPIAVAARVAWSSLVGRAPDGVPLYQSGLAFKKISEPVRSSLAAFFERDTLPVALPASVGPPPAENPRGTRGTARRRQSAVATTATRRRRARGQEARRRP
jgi:hypothetical protein